MWSVSISAVEIAALGVTTGLLYYSFISGIPLIIGGLFAAYKNKRV
jgi:hypothetical protein